MTEHVCTEKEVLKDIQITQARIEATLNGSQKVFYDHLQQGKFWRGIVATICVTVVLSIISFASMFGQLSKTVEVNERIILRILNKYEHLEMGGHYEDSMGSNNMVMEAEKRS